MGQYPLKLQDRKWIFLFFFFFFQIKYERCADDLWRWEEEILPNTSSPLNSFGLQYPLWMEPMAPSFQERQEFPHTHSCICTDHIFSKSMLCETQISLRSHVSAQILHRWIEAASQLRADLLCWWGFPPGEASEAWGSRNVKSLRFTWPVAWISAASLSGKLGKRNLSPAGALESGPMQSTSPSPCWRSWSSSWGRMVMKSWRQLEQLVSKQGLLCTTWSLQLVTCMGSAADGTLQQAAPNADVWAWHSNPRNASSFTWCQKKGLEVPSLSNSLSNWGLQEWSEVMRALIWGKVREWEWKGRLQWARGAWGERKAAMRAGDWAGCEWWAAEGGLEH